MEIIESFKKQAKKLNKIIVLPEGTESRTVKAAQIINNEKLARVFLVGIEKDIRAVASKEGVDLNGIEIIEPELSTKFEKYSQDFFELRKNKGITIDQARETIKDPIYFGTMMVQNGDADGLVSGAEHSTAETIRPALQIIKMKPGISVVSGCFIMIVHGSKLGENGTFIFADCAVNPDPTAEQLAEIAISSAHTASTLLKISPKVAMLSFSTKNSASHPFIDKVIEATRIAKDKAPDMLIDGELQVDAALIESVGLKKCPGSPVAGKANVLVFPDLQSGNIGYKLVERLANAQAIGPFLQGLKKPVNDLSRGCSIQDIVDVTVVTAIQSAE
jgi:phosphate acetyltransferase